MRRLLKLKRYEQPPPGYFHGFSGEVIVRIKLGERGEDSAVIERLLWEAPWLQRIWAAFEAKPVLAGAFGLAMCGMLIWGVIYSEKGDVQPVALIPVTESMPELAGGSKCHGGKSSTAGQAGCIRCVQHEPGARGVPRTLLWRSCERSPPGCSFPPGIDQSRLILAVEYQVHPLNSSYGEAVAVGLGGQ